MSFTNTAAGDVPSDASELVVPVTQLVTFAGGDRAAKERRQAAFGFAHYSTENDTQQQIVDMQRNYGIDSILSLLASSDPLCQRYSALALGNLASSSSVAERLVSNPSILEQVLPMALSPTTEIETKRYCLLTVANLSALKETHAILLDELKAISRLVDDFDREVQKCALLTIQNLTANVDLLMDLGSCIPLLVNVLSSSVALPDAKFYGVAALRGLSVKDELKLVMIKAGLLRQFVSLCEAPPLDLVLVEAAATLLSLSTQYDTHVELLQTDVLNTLFGLTASDLIDAQSFAGTALANVSCNADNHSRLVQFGAIPKFAILADSSKDQRLGQEGATQEFDEDGIDATNLTMPNEVNPMGGAGDVKLDPAGLGASAARALASFASDSSLHEEMLQESCVSAACTVLELPDAASRRFAALFFAVLSNDVTTHHELCSEELVAALFSLSICEIGEHVPVDVIRYTVLTLANLAAGDLTHELIAREVDIQNAAFLRIPTNTSDAECLRAYSLLWSNLATHADCHASFCSENAFETVATQLFTSESRDVQMNAMSAVLKISISDDIRELAARLIVPAMLENVGKEKLVSDKVHSPHETTAHLLLLSTAFLSNISKSAEVCKTVDWSSVLDLCSSWLTTTFLPAIRALKLKGISAAPNLLNNSSPDQHTCDSFELQMISFLMNLKDVETAMGKLGEIEPVLEFVCNCLETTNGVLQELSLNVLNALAQLKSSLIPLNKYNIVKRLAPFVRHARSMFRKLCFLALGHLASHHVVHTNVRNDDNRRADIDYTTVVDMRRVNILKCFLGLATSPNVDTEELRCCTFALANVSSHQCNRKHFEGSGVVLSQTIVYSLRGNDPDLCRSAALLFANLSTTLADHALFTTSDVIPRIANLGLDFYSLCPQTTVYAVEALFNLVSCGVHTKALKESDMFDGLLVAFSRWRIGNISSTDKESKNDLKRLEPNAMDAVMLRLIRKASDHPVLMMLIHERVDIIDYVVAALSFEQQSPREPDGETNNESTENRLSCALVAASALISLSSERKMRPAFATRGRLDGVISAIQLNDDALSAAIATLLAQIFQVNEVKNGTSDAANHALANLLKLDNLDALLATTWTLSHITIRGVDCIARLASLAMGDKPPVRRLVAGGSDEERSVSIGDHEPPEHQKNGSEALVGPYNVVELEKLARIRKLSLGALSNFSAITRNHDALIEHGAELIRKCFHLSPRDDDVVLWRHSALILSNFATNPKLRLNLSDFGDIGALDTFLSQEDAVTKQLVMSLLGSFALNEKLARVIVTSTRLLQLICLATLNSEDSEFLRLSAQFFYHLSVHSQSLRPLIMECRTLPCLVRLMSLQSFDLKGKEKEVASVSKSQINAVAAVLNLCFKYVDFGSS